MMPKKTPKIMRSLMLGCAIIAGAQTGLQSVGLAQIPDPLSRPERNQAQRAGTRALNVGAGHTQIVDLEAEARDIIVSNPAIASASLQSNRKLLITGISNGATSLYVLDREGRQIATYTVSVARDIAQLEQQLRTVLPNADISVTSVGNAVLLSGQVATAADVTLAVDLAKALTETAAAAGKPAAGSGNAAPTIINRLGVRASEQVMLQVTVAEVARSVVKQLGITHAGDWQIGDTTLAHAVTSSLTNFNSGGTGLVSNSSNSRFLKLDALEELGVARILAKPTAMAISGESGTIHVGGEVPVPVGMDCSNETTCQASIEFKKFGISLGFTPLVLDRGRISLNLEVEASEIDSANSTRVPAVNGETLIIPGFKTRKSTTTVELPSGGSVVSAGLFQVDNIATVTGVPGLMNVPVFGSLFRSRNYQKRETELVITVTPYIAKPVSPQKLALPDDNLIDASEPSAIFMGKINRIYTDKARPQTRSRATATTPGFIVE